MGTERYMRESRSTAETDSRAIRSYRRRQRRIRAIRRRCITAVMTLVLVFLCAFSYSSLQSHASTGEDARFKYFSAITVESGETLWSIAGEYMDDVNYKDRQDYIEEVCTINHLAETDTLLAGQTLIVPYYSSIYVK